MAQLSTIPTRGEPTARVRAAQVGLAAALALVVLGMAVPAVFRWDVHIRLAPIFAHWIPRVGPGTPPAIGLALLGLAYGDRLARTLGFPALLAAVTATSLAWSVSLALVDGDAGLVARADTAQLLHAARHVQGVSQLLRGFVDRIPLGAGSWNDHVAGHPPGALLVFLGLVHAHLGTGVLPGLVMAVSFAATPAGVMVTFAVLGAESSARAAAPFLVFCPAVIWAVVSADSLYACVAAWTLAALAAAATRRSTSLALISGFGFGAAVMLSYGLVLLAIPAVAILAAARSWRPMGAAAIGTAAVVTAMALAGFSWWSGYLALRSRYWAGIASERPAAYWLWGDLAALCFCAGPALGSFVACWASRLRSRCAIATIPHPDGTVVLVGGSVLLTIVVADLSLMSKAEVERIWLPFVPWVLVLSVLVPQRIRRPLLVVQVVAALLVQHLLATAW